MTNLMQANNQWATRPPEERFWTLEEMEKAARGFKMQAAESHNVDMRRLVAAPTATGDMLLGSPTGSKALLSHYAFGQMCGLTKIPAAYMRKLPSELAARCVNHGLQTDGNEEASFLMRQDAAGLLSLRAVTSKQYDRIWNADIIQRMTDLPTRGWVTPRAYASPSTPPEICRPATIEDVMPGSRIRVGNSIAPAGLYCSDKDMFVLMINPDRAIDVGGVPLFRGFYVENSEVGDRAFRLTTFLFNVICGNHIIWNAREVREFKVVHRGDRAEAKAWRGLEVDIRMYADQPGSIEEQKIAQTQKFLIPGKTALEAVDWLFKKNVATREALVAASSAIAQHPEDYGTADPRSAWAWAQGITRVSQSEEYMAARVERDKAAGKILQLAF